MSNIENNDNIQNINTPDIINSNNEYENTTSINNTTEDIKRTNKPINKIKPSFFELVKSMLILSNAVLFGITNAITEYGKKHNISPEVTNGVNEEIIQGGTIFLKKIINSKDINDLKNITNNKLNQTIIGGANLRIKSLTSYNILKVVDSELSESKIIKDSFKSFLLNETSFNNIINNGDDNSIQQLKVIISEYSKKIKQNLGNYNKFKQDIKIKINVINNNLELKKKTSEEKKNIKLSIASEKQSAFNVIDNRKSKIEKKRQYNDIINDIDNILISTNKDSIQYEYLNKVKNILSSRILVYLNTLTYESINQIKEKILKSIEEINNNSNTVELNKIIENLDQELYTILYQNDINKGIKKQENLNKLEKISQEKRKLLEKDTKMTKSLKDKDSSYLKNINSNSGFMPNMPNMPNISDKYKINDNDELLKKFKSFFDENMKKVNEKMNENMKKVNENINKNNQDESINNSIDISDSNEGGVTKKIIKNMISITDFFVSSVLDVVTGGSLNKSPEELASRTSQRIVVLADYLKRISNSPEQIQAIKEISMLLSSISFEIIDNVSPTINKIGNKVINLFENSSSQAVEGLMRTYMGVASSIVGQIPFFGGFVNILISIGIAFNTFMRLFRIFATTSSDVIVDGIQTGKKVSSMVSNKVTNVRKNFNTLINPKTGGGNKNRNTKKRNISYTKRITSSLYKFYNTRKKN
jgi:hypothetical protein